MCAAEVDNHISRDDIFDYHPLRECNIYFIISNKTSNPFNLCHFLSYAYHGEGNSKGKIIHSLFYLYTYACMEIHLSQTNVLLLQLITDAPFYKLRPKS